MTPSTPDKPKGMLRRLRRRNERAFVLVLLSLIMTALFLMAGFAVDLGYWYLRSAQIQRASDAAALAASIDMPDTQQATADALASAQKNGFTDGFNGVSIAVTPLDGGKIQVKIIDTNIATFFTSMIMSHVTISHVSDAERLAPVPMSTPYNVLGSGDLPIGGFPQQDFWLAINGYCTPKEDGDYYNAGYDGTRVFKDNGVVTSTPAGAYADHTDCTGETNLNYDPGGYNYTVTVPANSPGDVEVDVYDPEFNGFCSNPDWWSSFPNDWGYPTPGDGSCSPTFPSGHPANFNTQYTLYDTNNSTSTLDDNVVPGTSTQTFGYSNNSSWVQEWVDIGSLPANPTDEPHTYRLNVTEPPEANSFGVNSFAIRALRSWSSTTYCDIRDKLSPDCPEVAGEGAMSVNADAVSTTGFDTFYLADINPSYAGDTLTLNLWDPGEGFNELRLIAPDGSVMPLNWTATPSIGSQPAGSPASYGVDTSDDDPACVDASWSASGTVCPQPGATPRYGTSKLNDRLVSVTTQIPNDYLSYVTRAAGSTWWSVQYQADPNHSSELHDRTTWQIQIGGQQPAHLVPAS